MIALVLALITVTTPLRAVEVARNGGPTCKQVSSCEEAVQIWCNGYRRADADNDGIPCENVCHLLEQVNTIRSALGC